MKKIYIIVLIVLLIFIVFNTLKMVAFKDLEQVKVGKELVIEVKNGDVVDYAFFEKYDLWGSENIKMASFMKKNNLKLKPGQYIFNQAYDCERVKNIFRFEKIEKLN